MFTPQQEARIVSLIKVALEAAQTKTWEGAIFDQGMERLIEAIEPPVVEEKFEKPKIIWVNCSAKEENGQLVLDGDAKELIAKHFNNLKAENAHLEIELAKAHEEGLRMGETIDKYSKTIQDLKGYIAEGVKVMSMKI